MNRPCRHCGKDFPDEFDGPDCPHCGEALEIREPGEERTMPLDFEKTCSETLPPAPSVMEENENDLLQQGRMKGPGQLGSKGRIGRFEIVKELGRGGMGQVFVGVEPQTGTSVAIKMMLPGLRDDPRLVKAFMREARHMYQLSHPSILKVLEVSSPDEGPYFVMPMMRGGSLDDRIREDGVLKPDVAVDIGLQVARALSYAHGKGLLHRDIKPANILLDEEGRAYVTDFGLVRPFMNDSMIELDKTRLEGSPAYMSPRVAEGQAEDTRADIYAFGAVLYEMLVGRPPFVGQNAMQVLEAVKKGPPVSPDTLNQSLPAGHVEVVNTCMGRALRERYAAMEDVVEDLSRIQMGKAPLGLHRKEAQIGHAPLIAGSLAAVAVLALLGIFLLSRVEENGKPSEVADQSTLPAAAPPAASFRPSGEPPTRPPTPTTEEFSGTPEDWLKTGLQRFEEGKHRQGTELLRAVLAREPANEVAASNLVIHLFEFGHQSPAMHALNRWIEADPDNPTALALQKKYATGSFSTGRPSPPSPTGGSGEFGRPGMPPPGGMRPSPRPKPSP